MDIYINNQQNLVDITGLDSLIEKVIHAGLQVCQISEESEISITYVDNQSIQELNCQYRQMNVATDVLSFPQDQEDLFHSIPGMPRLLGDIVISLEKAVQQSEEFNHSFQREVGFLVAHGLLHLLGFDHQTDSEKQTMRLKERQIMEKVGLLRD